jgi:hypothetical protein
VNEPRPDLIEAAPIRDVSGVPLDKVPESRRGAGRSIEPAGWTSVFDPVRRQDFNRIDQADVTQRLGKTPCTPRATEPVGGSEEAVAVARRQGMNSVDHRREVCRKFECLVDVIPRRSK